MQRFDAVVLGGGGAGLFCAARLGAAGKKAVVLDHGPSPGRKILISGGGRCNFTNLHTGPDRFQSSNPHFCRSALARYQPKDFVALVAKHGIEFYEKKDGQLFCSDSAKRILAMLLEECARAGVSQRENCRILAVRRAAGGEFEIESSLGVFSAPALVVATGGLSIPKIGASGFGHDLARQFGLALVKPEPALVPFLMDESWQRRFAGLSGVAAEVTVRAGKKSFSEALLFTHRGLSGPAILQASLYWRPGEEIEIDFLPGLDEESWAREAKTAHADKTLGGVLSLLLPRRLAMALLGSPTAEKPLRGVALAEIGEILRGLRECKVRPLGTEGFEKAEVTRGGVSTEELSSKTMEAKKVPGLHFVGEVVDVTGELGGHNFQWAWASAAAAAAAIAGSLETDTKSE